MLALALVGGCSTLANLPLPPMPGTLKPPTITFQESILVQAPTQHQLNAYYCPDVLQGRTRVALGASMVCRGFFGPRPVPKDLAVAFDLKFRVENPNKVPLPMADVLTAVAVFPQVSNQRLGAVCTRLCGGDQPACSAAPTAGSCQASSRDVRSLSDFPAVATNLLVAGGIAAATGQPLSFTAPQVAAGETLDVVVRFSFGPSQLLATLGDLAAQSLSELETGRELSFRIPFRLEGTIWFDAGSVGRLAVPYGPIDGVWVFPTPGIAPALAVDAPPPGGT